MTNLPPKLKEKLDIELNRIQDEIDDEFNPENVFYRPAGSWRDNFEAGAEYMASLLLPENEKLKAKLRHAEWALNHVKGLRIGNVAKRIIEVAQEEMEAQDE